MVNEVNLGKPRFLSTCKLLFSGKCYRLAQGGFVVQVSGQREGCPSFSFSTDCSCCFRWLLMLQGLAWLNIWLSKYLPCNQILLKTCKYMLLNGFLLCKTVKKLSAFNTVFSVTDPQAEFAICQRAVGNISNSPEISIQPHLLESYSRKIPISLGGPGCVLQLKQPKGSCVWYCKNKETALPHSAHKRTHCCVCGAEGHDKATLRGGK